jgi:hypothetical protein
VFDKKEIMLFEAIDGFESEYIFCMWPGEDKMSPDRATELFSILANTPTSRYLFNTALVLMAFGNYRLLRFTLPPNTSANATCLIILGFI